MSLSAKNKNIKRRTECFFEGRKNYKFQNYAKTKTN